MSIRRIILFMGSVLLAAGVIALLVPVSIAKDDGSSIDCGSAVAEDLSSARATNNSGIAGVPVLNQVIPHTDYVVECESAVSSRRTWSIPLTVVGVLVVGGAALVGRSLSDRST
ncbi:MAG: aminopeptidase [Mycobacterium sp.]